MLTPLHPCALLLQGAAEMVLTRCTHMLDTTGSVVPLDGTARQQLEETITEMASRGLRTLCLSYRDISAAEVGVLDSLEEPPNERLVCCAVAGIKVCTASPPACCLLHRVVCCSTAPVLQVATYRHPDRQAAVSAACCWFALL